MLAITRFVMLYCSCLDYESIYRLNVPYKIITQINRIYLVHNFDIEGVTRLIAEHKSDELELHNLMDEIRSF